MTLKQKLVTGYVVVAFIFAFYAVNFGPFQHKSFAYNLGRGIVWPFTIFPTMGIVLSVIVIGVYAAFVLMGSSGATAVDE